MSCRRRSAASTAGATLVVLPDPVIGQRLIGNAEQRDVVQAALTAVGVNPIVAAAFRDRSRAGRRDAGVKPKSYGRPLTAH